MILEVAILDIRQGQEQAFEAAFGEAAPIIAGMPGCISHQLQRCIEQPGRYLMLVNWRSLEDHTSGFRESPGYARRRALLR